MAGTEILKSEPKTEEVSSEAPLSKKYPEVAKAIAGTPWEISGEKERIIPESKTFSVKINKEPNEEFLKEIKERREARDTLEDYVLKNIPNLPKNYNIISESGESVIIHTEKGISEEQATKVDTKDIKNPILHALIHSVLAADKKLKQIYLKELNEEEIREMMKSSTDKGTFTKNQDKPETDKDFYIKKDQIKKVGDSYLIPIPKPVVKLTLDAYFFKSLPKEVKDIYKNTFSEPPKSSNITLYISNGKIASIESYDPEAKDLSDSQIKALTGQPLTPSTLKKVEDSIRNSMTMEAAAMHDSNEYLNAITKAVPGFVLALDSTAEESIITLENDIEAKLVTSEADKKILKRNKKIGEPSLDITLDDNHNIQGLELSFTTLDNKGKVLSSAKIDSDILDAFKGKLANVETLTDIKSTLQTMMPNIIRQRDEETREKLKE